MRLLTSQLLSHPHDLIGNNSLYTLDDEKLLEREAIEQFPLIFLVLALLFVSLSHEVAHHCT